MNYLLPPLKQAFGCGCVCGVMCMCVMCSVCCRLCAWYVYKRGEGEAEVGDVCVCGVSGMCVVCGLLIEVGYVCVCVCVLRWCVRMWCVWGVCVCVEVGVGWAVSLQDQNW